MAKKLRKISNKTRARYRKEILRDFEKIKASPDLYAGLPTRKKLIYKAYASKPWENFYKVDGKRRYDYGGLVSQVIDQVRPILPELKGRDLDTLPKDQKRIVKDLLSKTTQTQKVAMWQPSNFNTSLYVPRKDFSRSGKLKAYKLKEGGKLDVLQTIKQLERAGFKFQLNNSQKDALRRFEEFERQAIDKRQPFLKPGEKIVIRHEIKLDPFKKVVVINTKNSKAETWGDTDRNVPQNAGT